MLWLPITLFHLNEIQLYDEIFDKQIRLNMTSMVDFCVQRFRIILLLLNDGTFAKVDRGPDEQIINLVNYGRNFLYIFGLKNLVYSRKTRRSSSAVDLPKEE